MAPLALVTSLGQIHAVEVPSGASRPVTGLLPSLNAWNAPEGRFAWPLFSPDGRRIAAFCGAAPGEEAPQAVEVHELDGVGGVRVLERGAGVPIHARWSPDGRHLAVLLQVEDRLELVVVPADAPGAPRLVDEGVPLFYAWLDDGRLVVHAGSGGGQPGRVVVRDPLGDQPDAALPFPAGRFCAPIVVDDAVVAAMGGAGGSALVRMSLSDESVQPLFAAPGLLAFLPAPVGRALAVAHAPALDRPPYAGVWRVDIDSGAVVPLVEGPVDAFQWLPDGRRLLVARRDPAGGRVVWVLCDGGREHVVGAVRPTADQRFHLHFFEQFDRSHPQVDPTGRWLVQARWTRPGGGVAEVAAFDLDAPGVPPHVLGEGRYGVFPIALPPLV